MEEDGKECREDDTIPAFESFVTENDEGNQAEEQQCGTIASRLTDSVPSPVNKEPHFCGNETGLDWNQHVEHRVDFTIGSDSGISIDADKLQQHQINARDFFVPTQESWLLMSADYSQIELRLMAHFSEDASLLGLLRKPDGDLFRMIAARWTEQNESAITEKQRDQTKKLIYGILYGMGVNTLAEHLECSVAEAAERYNRFKSAFPGVSSWLHQAVERCRQKGCKAGDDVNYKKAYHRIKGWGGGKSTRKDANHTT